MISILYDIKNTYHYVLIIGLFFATFVTKIKSRPITSVNDAGQNRTTNSIAYKTSCPYDRMARHSVIEKAKKTRCGKPNGDSSDSSNASDEMQCYTLSPNSFAVTDLTYTVLNYSSWLNKEDVDYVLRRAFNMWSSVSKLNFKKIPKENDKRADIEIEFVPKLEENTLAQAPYPGNVGTIEFSDSHDWTIDSYEGTNLRQTSAHEIGHAVGIAHSTVETAVMFPTYPNGISPDFTLDPDDISAIQELYGAREGPFDVSDERPSWRRNPEPPPRDVQPSDETASRDIQPSSYYPATARYYPGPQQAWSWYNYYPQRWWYNYYSRPTWYYPEQDPVTNEERPQSNSDTDRDLPEKPSLPDADLSGKRPESDTESEKPLQPVVESSGGRPTSDSSEESALHDVDSSETRPRRDAESPPLQPTYENSYYPHYTFFGGNHYVTYFWDAGHCTYVPFILNDSTGNYEPFVPSTTVY